MEMSYELAGYYSVIARVERAITRVIARSISLHFLVFSFCYDFVTKKHKKAQIHRTIKTLSLLIFIVAFRKRLCHVLLQKLCVDFCLQNYSFQS